MIIIYYLLGCLLALVAIVAIMEFTIFIVYGGFVSKQITDVYMNLDESKLRLNQFDPSILQRMIIDDQQFVSTGSYITNVPFGIFSKYYINGLGTIPRWSKLHKRVNEYFAIVCRNDPLISNGKSSRLLNKMWRNW